MKKLKVEAPATPDVESSYEESDEKHNCERMMAMKLAQQGKYTLQEMASILDRSR